MSNTPRGTRFELARVTIEMTSPFLVGTGKPDLFYDSQFASTADRLPVLPGTSIAGVLRHAYAGDDSSSTGARVKAAFGHQDGDAGAASSVEISFGHVHDKNDLPVKFIGQPGIDTDPVLKELKAGLVRDHVRINSRGTVDDNGKFDAWMVPAGARFTFEIVVHDGKGINALQTMEELISLLECDAIRLGGRTRRGLGEFRVVRARHASFDLTKSDSFDAFLRLPRDLSQIVPEGILKHLDVHPAETPHLITFKIELEPESWWLFGGGDPIRDDHSRNDGEGNRAVDSVNAHEVRIEWDGNRAKVVGGRESRDVAPGTSLKGALRHRVAFHARRLNKKWVNPDRVGEGPESEDAIADLFGSVADSKRGEETGQTGRIWISDATIEMDSAGFLDHVSLDRFTQGARSGLLFNEAARFGGYLVFEGVLDSRNTEDLKSETKEALKAALEDLTMGQLAFGASSSRGFGVAMKGKIVWSDGGKWLEER